MTAPGAPSTGRGGAGPVASPRLVVVSGPSGVGKTTIAARLLEDRRFGRAVTATTRPPRGGESDGVDYHFLSDPDFDRAVAEDRLLEWAVVYGNRRYGTPRENVHSVLESGRHCLLVVDVQGAATLRRLGTEALYVFVKAPSLQEMERRLRGREQDSPPRIVERLAAARRELTEEPAFDLTLVNDEDPEAAARRLARRLGIELE